MIRIIGFMFVFYNLALIDSATSSSEKLRRQNGDLPMEGTTTIRTQQEVTPMMPLKDHFEKRIAKVPFIHDNEEIPDKVQVKIEKDRKQYEIEATNFRDGIISLLDKVGESVNNAKEDDFTTPNITTPEFTTPEMTTPKMPFIYVH